MSERGHPAVFRMATSDQVARRTQRGASPCLGSHARDRRPLSWAPAARGLLASLRDSAATPPAHGPLMPRRCRGSRRLLLLELSMVLLTIEIIEFGEARYVRKQWMYRCRFENCNEIYKDWGLASEYYSNLQYSVILTLQMWTAGF